MDIYEAIDTVYEMITVLEAEDLLDQRDWEAYDELVRFVKENLNETPPS